jgi:hypothetical protein
MQSCTHFQAVSPVWMARSPRDSPSGFHSQNIAPRSGRSASRLSETALYTVLEGRSERMMVVFKDCLTATSVVHYFILRGYSCSGHHSNELN